jgi:predicted RNase H-like HicB family nuclease
MTELPNITFQMQPEDGHYSAVCPELGTASCGDTVEEATANLREAATLHLETLHSLGQGPRFPTH